MSGVWRRDGHGRYVHATGASIERTTNDRALRRWYVQLDTGPIAEQAARAGLVGGFFSLRAAKEAVETAARESASS